ncbi:hypothetical protein MMC30_005435 [Trapelia coarctata]|nr:hypothetical protein [Trapelia coarctata]
MVTANTEICTAECHCRADPGSFGGRSARMRRPSIADGAMTRDPSASKLSASEMDYGSHPARGNLASLQRASTLPVQLHSDQASSGQSSPGQLSPGQLSPGQLSSGQSSPGLLTPGQMSPGLRSVGQSFSSQSTRGPSPLGPSPLGPSPLGLSPLGQLSRSQSTPNQPTPAQTSSGQGNLGQSVSSQQSPDQTSPDQASPDAPDSEALSGAPLTPSLSKRGGAQSRLDSPGGSSSDDSTNSLFTLQCNVRYHDSCDLHCRCDDEQNVQCDKQTSQTVEGLSRNFSKSWIKKGVQENVAKTRKRCSERCHCVNTFHRNLLGGMRKEQRRLTAKPGKVSRVSKPRRLVGRGGIKSCLKSSGDCSSDTVSTPQTPPPDRVLILRCDDSSHQHECDPDCYCTADRKVKCDAKFAQDLRKLMPGLRNAYTGKHQVTNVLRACIIEKEQQCGGNCHCEDGPVETSAGPSTTRGQSSPNAPDSKLATSPGSAQAPINLAKRGGVASCLKSPEGCPSPTSHTSSNSPASIFTLACVPVPDHLNVNRCEANCDCTANGKVTCDVRKALRIKELTTGEWPMKKHQAANLVNSLLYQKTKACQKECQCNDESSTSARRGSQDTIAASQRLRVLQRSSMSTDQSTPYSRISQSSMSQSPHLHKRGSANSRIKLSGGSLSESSPKSPPSAVGLICDEPSLKSHFDSDCYCTASQKLKCDRRAETQVNALTRGMLSMPLSKSQAKKIVNANVQRRTEECSRLCHCGKSAVETPGKPPRSLIQRSPDPSDSKPLASSATDSSSGSKPSAFDPKPPRSTPIPIPARPHVLERGHGASSLNRHKPDTIDSPLIPKPPPLRPADLKVQCRPQGLGANTAAKEKEVSYCLKHCSCANIGKPECNIDAREIMDKLGAGSRGLSAQQARERTHAAAYAVAANCGHMCTCVNKAGSLPSSPEALVRTT